jgi:hypothetical protein
MMMKRLLYSFLMMGLLMLLTGSNVWAYTMEECIECHKEGSDKAELHIPLEVFKASIHNQE